MLAPSLTGADQASVQALQLSRDESTFFLPQMLQMQPLGHPGLPPAARAAVFAAASEHAIQEMKAVYRRLDRDLEQLRANAMEANLLNATAQAAVRAGRRAALASMPLKELSSLKSLVDQAVAEVEHDSRKVKLGSGFLGARNSIPPTGPLPGGMMVDNNPLRLEPGATRRPPSGIAPNDELQKLDELRVRAERLAKRLGNENDAAGRFRRNFGEPLEAELAKMRNRYSGLDQKRIELSLHTSQSQAQGSQPQTQGGPRSTTTLGSAPLWPFGVDEAATEEMIMDDTPVQTQIAKRKFFARKFGQESPAANNPASFSTPGSTQQKQHAVKLLQPGPFGDFDRAALLEQRPSGVLGDQHVGPAEMARMQRRHEEAQISDLRTRARRRSLGMGDDVDEEIAARVPPKERYSKDYNAALASLRDAKFF
ncbi:unnamed protein product [Amoebophrya sp. A25]|nr:unnamed protein product [Amoebophrya sp. A25]|eukprot:GSA25T00020162001.1